MSFIIERHFWPPFCFFGDIIDNKKTSVSLHGWDRPRGNQSCPLGPILGHEKWKFQGDVDHHLCCAFSLCLISLLYSQRVFSRYHIYISSYIFEIIRIMYEGNKRNSTPYFIHFLQLGNHSQLYNGIKFYSISMVFCFYFEKNCSRDRERICIIFEITRTINSNSERSGQFLVTECFFKLFLDVSHI